jgi:hypothetical protein
MTLTAHITTPSGSYDLSSSTRDGLFSAIAVILGHEPRPGRTSDAIVEFLASKGPSRVCEIARGTGRALATVANSVKRMVKDKRPRIERSGYGIYRIKGFKP